MYKVVICTSSLFQQENCDVTSMRGLAHLLLLWHNLYMLLLTGRRCGTCQGCKAQECGCCKYCLDKPKYGGKGRLKQRCIRTRCNQGKWYRWCTFTHWLTCNTYDWEAEPCFNFLVVHAVHDSSQHRTSFSQQLPKAYPSSALSLVSFIIPAPCNKVQQTHINTLINIFTVCRKIVLQLVWLNMRKQ